MTPRRRVHAALEGRPVDRFPVTSLYHYLYVQDHFAELTGRPQRELWRWLYAPPEQHLSLYRELVETVPFEVLQPQPARTREERENTEVIERDDIAILHDKRADTFTPMQPVSGHAFDDRANETQYVFDEGDANERIVTTPAERLIAAGHSDYARASVEALGADHFILSGGVTGVLWACGCYVGVTNLLAMLIEQPRLIEHMSKRIREQSVEVIRQTASAGGDAIFVDDALATNDMISVAHYERFCLPHVRELVREIHRLGHKAILIYFGGIADRLEQIASLGADGLAMETSMKGYVNDIGEFASAIGGRVTLFGNVDPIRVLQDGTDETLEAEMRHQANAGRTGRGFIMCTGSPITPRTPLWRVRRFIELGRAM